VKTALAPTAELATPKVERFVKTKLLPAISDYAKLEQFYLCDPATSDVSNQKGERWTEANWGARIVCDYFSIDQFYDLTKLSEVIQIGGASMRGADSHKLELNLWLCARVMR
jgi:hypothetical protein